MEMLAACGVACRCGVPSPKFRRADPERHIVVILAWEQMTFPYLSEVQVVVHHAHMTLQHLVDIVLSSFHADVFLVASGFARGQIVFIAPP